VRVVKQRGKNLKSKRGVNISLRELVHRIAQEETNGPKPELEKAKLKRITPKLQKRRKQQSLLSRSSCRSNWIYGPGFCWRRGGGEKSTRQSRSGAPRLQKHPSTGKASGSLEVLAALLGQVGGGVRRPMLELTTEERDATRKAFESSGLKVPATALASSAA
jgi:hypothetical protein